MKYKGFLLSTGLLSAVIFLTTKWYGTNLTKTHPRPTPTQVLAPPPVIRKSMTLHDGAHSYHLNLAAFEKEFPYLQSYRCAFVHKPAKRLEVDHGLVVLAVKSHPRTGVRRAALRRTWATERLINGYRVRPVFLLGKSTAAGNMEMVKLENQVYGDILQWDFTESHHNLSLKEFCLLEWLHRDLPKVEYIFKGDDDEFVNPELIVQYITEHGTPHTVHGYHQHRPPVMRVTKYSITKTLYPQERYPGFVSGGGFLYPGAAVKSLYKASQILPVFPLDDVYFGFLTLAANMTYRHDRRFHVYGLKFEACSYKQKLVVHGISPDFMVKIWQEIQDADCGKPKSKPR